MKARRRIALGSFLFALAIVLLCVARWVDRVEKRVAIVEPGRIVRGAWQNPDALLDLIRRERIRTVITLTAINRDDTKYVSQERAIKKSGVDWILIPMRGSRATLEQMAEAADLVADPSRQPVFFHCVGGHHRSSLVQAAYRIKHRGWTAEAAWGEVSSLSWARPGAAADVSDRRLIEEFAASYGHSPRKDLRDEAKIDQVDPAGDRAGRGDRGRVLPVAMGEREFRHDPARPDVPRVAADGRVPQVVR